MRNKKEKVFILIESAVIILEVVFLTFLKIYIPIAVLISLFYIFLNFSENLKYNNMVINKKRASSLIFTIVFCVLLLFSIISDMTIRTEFNDIIFATEMSIKLSFFISFIWIFRILLRKETKEKTIISWNKKIIGLQIVILCVPGIFSHLTFISYVGLILCQIIGIIQVHM